MATQAATAPRTTPLSADEIVEFAERGFVRPGRILTEDQVAALCEALERARERERSAGREYDLLDPSLWPEGEAAARARQVGRLPLQPLAPGRPLPRGVLQSDARAGRQLIGSRQVRLLEDGAIFKEPGGKGGSLKWHQDYAYWPIAMPAAATAWIALDHVTLENGAMKMAVGSHLTGERPGRVRHRARRTSRKSAPRP